MTTDVELVRIWRGDMVESVHRGHAVICDGAGTVIEAWGTPSTVIYPRSSSKMLQALPLLESGAGRDLSDQHLALACASHRGEAMHVTLARDWLSDLGLDDGDLRCGAHAPYAPNAAADLIRSGESACQVHNNCSGKHCGFLTLAQHLGAGPEYIDPEHPVQKAVKAATEEVAGMDSPGFGIDGCSAPNFAIGLDGFAGALGRFARGGPGVRGAAMSRLVGAMMGHPELVSGTTGTCARLIRALDGRGAVKTGAEAVYAAILPEMDRGIAVKITDGGTRAAEAVITALLVHVGALPREADIVRELTHGPIRNVGGLATGHLEVTLT